MTFRRIHHCRIWWHATMIAIGLFAAYNTKAKVRTYAGGIAGKTYTDHFIDVDLYNRGTLPGQWNCFLGWDTCLFIVNDGVIHNAPYARSEVHYDPLISELNASCVVIEF